VLWIVLKKRIDLGSYSAVNDVAELLFLSINLNIRDHDDSVTRKLSDATL
jgi:hypothetical protein